MWAWGEVVRGWVAWGLREVVATTVVRPFTQLYLRGPTALGFWGGLPAANVCARLTKTDTNFWLRSDENIHECTATIDREINAWMTVLAAVAYCTAGCMFVSGLLARCRPQPAAGALPPMLVIKNLPVAALTQKGELG